MTIRHYTRLLLLATLVVLPLLLFFIIGIDEPLAYLVHHYGAPLQPAFGTVMRGLDWLQGHFFYHGLPIGWLALLLAFLTTRLLRHPTSTVWLVTLFTLVGSEGLTNLLKGFFNRPRPLEVWSQAGPNAGFWQSAGRFDAFPSGHTAWIAGLLLPLALRFPKLRVGLLGLIGVVALGRVGLEAHWLSDVAASIYLALVLTCSFEIGTWWLRPWPAARVVSAAADAT